MGNSSESVRVLHVDDEPDFAELAAEFIEREAAQITVDTARSAETGLAKLASHDYDCIVSDYDMQEANGIQFLETVRETDDRLPFILYTGKGSEEIASQAISAGVTDYLQKQSGTSQYTILRNRISNAVERRAAREAVTETEEQLRILAENTDDILWMYTADWEELIFINSAYEEIWGRPIEELSWFPPAFQRGVHPEDRSITREAMDDLSDGAPIDIEFRVNAAENYGRWVWVEGQPIRNQDGEVTKVTGFARDITERKAREQELQAATETYETLVEASPVPIWVQGFDEIYFANEAAADLHGVDDPESLIGESAMGFVPEDEVERARQRNQRIISEEEHVEPVVGTVVRPDGSTREAVMAAAPIRYHDAPSILAVASDITEERERDRELEAANRQLDAILENTPTPIFMKDDEGRYIFANAGYGEAFGVDDTELVGRTDRELFPPEMAEVVEHNDQRVLDAGEAIEVEETIPTGDGERVYRSTKVPIYDTGHKADSEEPVAIFGVATDITTLKQREQTLQKERDRLDAFASVVSHDLRNPLSVARGRLELAREEADSDDLRAVSAAIDRMGSLIEAILSVAREGTAVDAVERVALDELVAHCWSGVMTDSASLEINTRTTIQADPSRLQQVFENLFRNAIEHGGDDVVVTVGELDDGFYVEDNGPGVPVARREEVFQMGVTTAPESTGFGLAIVEEVATAHDWDVELRTAASGGARFEFTGVQRPEQADR